MNLADRLQVAAGRLAGRAVVTLDEAEITYDALELMSARVASMLRRRGIGVGDRVAVMLPNVPEFAVVYYGVLRIGAVVVPLDPLLRRREIASYVGDCGARLLIAWHALAETAEAGTSGTGADCFFVVPEEFRRLLRGVEAEHEIVARAAGDTAVIHYTSGTTGRAKGIELTHANLVSNATTVARMHALGVDDVVLGALPLYHAFGQTCSLNASIHAGARLTLLPRFEPGRALEVIRRDGVTVFQGVPTMYIALLDHLGVSDMSLLRLCVSGGAALPLDVLRVYEARFGCLIMEGYGLSETSPSAATNRGGPGRRPGSIGWPIKDVEMKVVDDDRRRGAVRPGRRDRHPGPQRDEGLLEQSRRDRGGDPRRLVPHRRPRQGRRRRVLLPGRPAPRRDHPGRTHRVSPGGGGGPVRAPRRTAGGGHRESPIRSSGRRSRRWWCCARRSRPTACAPS